MSAKRFVLLLLILLPWCLPGWAADAPRTITVYVTVDWEGWSLDDENIEAMQTFRQRHPQISMLQLLNPVYFLRPGADAGKMIRQIRATLLPSDAHGLHLHAWKSLMQHCGLPYRSTPSFAPHVNENCGSRECGYTVSLERAYTQEELTKLVACSADLLVQHGFDRPTHFRAGAWQAGSRLTAALQANGFTWDSSRTDARFLAEKWGASSAIVEMVRQLHPEASPLDQPYALGQGLTEYPNNGSLADYTGTGQIVEMFKTLITNGKNVLVLGFHQETAFDFLDNLEAAIPLLEQEAELAGVRLEWARYRNGEATRPVTGVNP